MCISFDGCVTLESIIIPEEVKAIMGAFNNCINLTSITIPSSVTSIGDYAFSGCSGLTSITIPNSVTYIGEYAFSGCRKLAEITCLNTVVPSIGNSTFYSLPKNGVLKVPSGSDYSSWMDTSKYYLGYYNWTIEYI